MHRRFDKFSSKSTKDSLVSAAKTDQVSLRKGQRDDHITDVRFENKTIGNSEIVPVCLFFYFGSIPIYLSS